MVERNSTYIEGILSLVKEYWLSKPNLNLGEVLSYIALRGDTYFKTTNDLTDAKLAETIRRLIHEESLPRCKSCRGRGWNYADVGYADIGNCCPTDRCDTCNGKGFIA